jgi:dipeptide/tripeptide permease
LEGKDQLNKTHLLVLGLTHNSWIADGYLGRFATIQYSIIAAIIGHVLLICSSIPSVMDNPSGALGLFSVGLIIMVRDEYNPFLRHYNTA